MNRSVEPCDDFYEFACGNWPVHHNIPKYQFSIDWFDGQQDLLLANISRFLTQKDSPNDPYPVQKARTFYRSCIKHAKSKDENFTAIENILRKVDLPTTPFNNSPSGDFSWLNTAVLSKAAINQDFFISFSISSDPKNRTVNRLRIAKPTGDSPLPTHRNSERILRQRMKELIEQSDGEEFSEEDFNNSNISEEYKTTFVQYVRNMSQYVVQLYGENWNETEFNETILHVLDLHVAVDKSIEDYYENDSLIPSYITIDELQKMTDEITNNSAFIDWKKYFELMFKVGGNFTLDWNSNDSKILMSDEKYFRTIFPILSSTEAEVIKFYMWMTLVATVAPYSNKPLQKFKEDFVRTMTQSEQKPRDLYCADVVNQMLGMATAYSVVDDQFMKQKIKKIETMVDYIMDAFAENTRDLQWMDETTKNATVRKIRAMKKLIGIPTWLNETKELEEYYENLNVSEDNFLDNILKKIQMDHVAVLQLYKELNDFDQDTWVSNPMDVNAYNYMEGNAITIPAGILQFPFYGQGLEALNYGAIGSVIGHEITHSFDNTGKEYDDVGNVNPWWTNKTKTEFENRTNCFVDYYGSFSLPGSEEKVNGQKTLDENIADNGGLRSAFIAYKKYVKEHGQEFKLTDFKDYSSEQLYFLGFANTWCEHSTEYSVQQAATDSHSPNKIRVIATLSNSEEFADTWKCKRGSKMNPDREKCRMW
ncbi:hypothetical protein V9T40_003204 [Parthenolecanium corni]|uniref:Endothelin-converting enzyme 1 n=1 Tax=Parthenolecanium corni TaxID=536013 RepID=A0AAN9TUW4_9HEMI